MTALPRGDNAQKGDTVRRLAGEGRKAAVFPSAVPVGVRDCDAGRSRIVQTRTSPVIARLRFFYFFPRILSTSNTGSTRLFPQIARRLHSRHNGITLAELRRPARTDKPILFSVHNKQSAACGEPPYIDGNMPNRYHTLQRSVSGQSL